MQYKMLHPECIINIPKSNELGLESRNPQSENSCAHKHELNYG